MRTWRSEHGEEYQVPAEIEREFKDMSWHNEAMPNFGVPGDDGQTLRLWVDHPDPQQRAVPNEPEEAPRFMVCYGDYGELPEEMLYEGNDMNEAVRVMREAAKRLFGSNNQQQQEQRE